MIEYTKPIQLCFDRTLGYVYFTDREHPLASSRGKVYYHRHVASLKLGRWLREEEVAHHCDGNRANNSPENLGVYTSNGAHLKKAHRKQCKRQRCAVCFKEFEMYMSTLTFCSHACAQQASRRFTVSAEELNTLVWVMPTTKVAELLGVSGTAIAKRCRLLGVKKPPRGYWAKQHKKSEAPEA